MDLFGIGDINKDTSPCLYLDMWRVICININTKGPHTPRMHNKNGNNHIMGPKTNGHPTK